MGRILFFSETQKKENNGGTKAREDIDHILKEKGYLPVECRMCRDFTSPKNVIDSLISIRLNWRRLSRVVQNDDTLIIQYPFGDYKTNLKQVKKFKNKKNLKVVALIHDLPSIQDNSIESSEEIELLKLMDVIICHNEKMKEKLIELKLDQDKLVCLEIFDYLCENVEKRQSKNDGITVAGNLSSVKAQYIYKLIGELKGKDLKFNLYGPNFELDSYELYHGSLSPEKLIKEIKGSYGLIWDGDSLEECNGVFGRYQTINNPHRVSMNLVAKMPILIWKNAALSDFVRKYNVGVVIDSLLDLEDTISNISDEKYEEMQKNLEVLSEKLRTGYFTNKAIDSALEKLGEK